MTKSYSCLVFLTCKGLQFRNGDLCYLKSKSILESMIESLNLTAQILLIIVKWWISKKWINCTWKKEFWYHHIYCLTIKKVFFFILLEKSYLTGQFRQIKGSLVGHFREIKYSLAEQFRHIKHSLAEHLVFQ